MPPNPTTAPLRALALASVAAILALAACGGSSDDEATSTDATTSQTTTEADTPGGVRPEIVAATQEVIAHLEAEGAKPDPVAAERNLDEFEASKRLLFPPGGPECRIRDIAAGSQRLVDFVQVSPIYEETVTDPDETVALALDLPNVDPGSPASRRCIEATTAALARLGGSSTPSMPAPRMPEASAELVVRGSGVTTTRGGFFVGALIENTSDEDFVDVEVGFDVLNAAGEAIGASQPVRLRVVPAGAGTGSTRRESPRRSRMRKSAPQPAGSSSRARSRTPGHGRSADPASAMWSSTPVGA